MGADASSAVFLFLLFAFASRLPNFTLPNYHSLILSLLQSAPLNERPRGVLFIAALLFLSALASLAVAALNFFGLVPLAFGAPIVGAGLEVLGPLIFIVYSATCAAAATGLLRLRNWARWLTIAILLFGLVLVTPAVSMAVADGRIAAILREGLQIILRTAALWYLYQEPVRDHFS